MDAAADGLADEGLGGAGALLLTCEHAGRRVPARYRWCFEGAEEVLASHRGWDPGALPLARRLAQRLDAPLLACLWTRLLVEANRSPTHPALFSRYTRDLPRAERAHLLARYWAPHRGRVIRWLDEETGAGRRVLHLAVHTFTPVLDGEVRRVDVGVLYDPARAREGAFADAFVPTLAEHTSVQLRVRRNQPYRGVADGLTTAMRRRLPEDLYLGIELEVSQGLVARPGTARRRVAREIGDALAAVLGGDGGRG